ncbi:valyl-tRNA synthetase [Mycoplasmoides fastidiosum]|uniref:Valine--tRNA ligase n=1 Tax=Mycoplasmoides fastidiosum TaxID=92758 RepID=A0ABU0LZV3_9BACT|nr:valine--tRNA ligase [Mycoplasmoides fastidiosum]MDQ0514225.1 valyl-tRNA synthetase [Mycoplasmoides fastidiosum]UUD37367.1 valine--tRNA ligase [Mycoplasmoides fastidiosum]
MSKPINFYQHQQIENQIPSGWQNLAIGTIASDQTKYFSIVLPPPNVTGILHLGHAWDGTLQDMLIRFYKLQKYNVLWASGMDHAGIATQTKFEKELREKQIDKDQYTRQEFNALITEWKNQHAQTIRQQWAKMGFCLSKTNERFTLDDHSVQVVLDSFAELYQKGLIYRAEKLVNWDTHLQTAISNIEIIHKEVADVIYHIDYTCATNSEIKLKVSTTRPETMFGDVCLVVNPDDQRYQKYLNLEFINPANNQPLKIITDPYVDPSFGSGVMKCTPAHDFNDYQIGLDHQLPLVKCIGLDGKMLNNCLEFSGLDKTDCRQQLVAKFKRLNILKTEPHINNVGYSDRTNVVIEPMLSEQWFVKTSVVAKKTKEILEQNPDQLSFFPDNFLKQMFHYLSNMEDWCISRQLTWGIQIPIFYNQKTKAIVNATTAPDQSGDWVQDSDVFDTWYSSGLWPLTTTETYKNQNSRFQHFFPTSVLVTGTDILFFWVSRMMMFGAVFGKLMPFKKVYLHGLIRDQLNRKMSKSLGNGVDPQELIQQYGADATRLFFIDNTNSGEDLIYVEAKVKDASAFINKFWNAYNFLQHKNINLTDTNFDLNTLNWSEKWIYAKLAALNKQLLRHYEQLQFNLISKKITDFVWNDFCGWFIEFIKFNFPNRVQVNSQKFISFIWHKILILLNPLIPFVTEFIYDQIHQTSNQFYNQVDVLIEFEQPEHPWFFQFIQAVRNIRNELKDHHTKWQFIIHNNDKNNHIATEITAVTDLFAMVNCELINSAQDQTKISFAIKNYLFDLYCSFEQTQQYQEILNKKIAKLNAEVVRSENILANQNFLLKATTEKVELEKIKLKNYQEELKNYQLILKLQK